MTREELLDMLKRLEKRHAYWTVERMHLSSAKYSGEYVKTMLLISRRDINRIRNQLGMELI